MSTMAAFVSGEHIDGTRPDADPAAQAALQAANGARPVVNTEDLEPWEEVLLRGVRR